MAFEACEYVHNALSMTFCSTIGGAVAYFIIGIVVMKLKFKAEGLEIIPNRKFWMDFPILVKVFNYLLF